MVLLELSDDGGARCSKLALWSKVALACAFSKCRFINIIQPSAFPSQVPRYFVDLFFVSLAVSRGSTPIDMAVEIASAIACRCKYAWNIVFASTMASASSWLRAKFLFVLTLGRVLEATSRGGFSLKANTGWLVFASVDNTVW